MKARKLLWLLPMLAVVGYTACRKTDSRATEEPSLQVKKSKFFNEHTSTNPQVQGLMKYVQRENEKYQFVENVVKQIGYPRWDKALIVDKPQTQFIESGDDSVTITHIPFVRDSQNYVNASLVIRTTPDDTSVRYLCDWQYHNRVHGPASVDTTAERHTVFFMILDNRVFGHTEFRVTDPDLFTQAGGPGGEKKLGFVNISGSRGGFTDVFIYHEVCVDFYVCGDPDGVCANGCDYLNCAASQGSPLYCYLVSSVCDGWWDDTENGGGGGSGSGSGGTGGSPPSGGGGCGSCWTPPPCGAGGTLRPEEVTNPCGPGYVPIEPEDPPVEDPCIRVAPLKQDADFKNSFQYLKSKAVPSETREYGFYGKKSGPYILVYGEENVEDGVNFHIFDTIKVIMHSHPWGLPIFSVADFETVAGVFDAHLIDNVYTFTIGLATDSGSYILTIDNLQKFKTFLDDYIDESTGSEDFEELYKAHKIKDAGSAEQGVINFLEMLTSVDAGMTLLKANDDFSGYSKLSTSNNILHSTPCN